MEIPIFCHEFVSPSILLSLRSIEEKTPQAREWKNALVVRAGLFQIEIMANRSWKREEANKLENDGKEASEREERKRAKEIESQKKRIREEGREKQREERARAYARWRQRSAHTRQQ